MQLPPPATVPRVSIIMIFLDARRFIAEAIESVLAQTYHDWELILIDDGSTDGTTSLAQGYCANYPDRIRYFTHPRRENRGTGASRNLGLACASGEFVAFLDADDVYLPERLARHLELLNAHQEVAMVQSRHEYWHTWQLPQPGSEPDSVQNAPPVKFGVPIRPPDLLILLLRSRGTTLPGVCSITIRRSALANLGGFDESFRTVYEDQVLLAKLYLHVVVIVLEDCLARYRQHRSSMVHSAEARGEFTPGRPDASRKRFIEWLKSYLRSKSATDPELWSSLQDEAWPYQHPLLWNMIHLPNHVLRFIRQVGERVLPERLSRAIVRWRQQHKIAAARARALRAGARLSRQREQQ